MHNLTSQSLRPELSKLYWSQGFSTLGGGLVAIFIPIFLLKLHYSLAAVLTYMIFYGLFCIPTLYIALHLVPKIGSNRIMAIANISQAMFLALLITLPTRHWPLLSLSVLAAWVNSAYWPAFHANFAIARTPSRSGRQLSYIYTLMAVASALAPAIGGILATIFNIKLVYGLAAGIFIVAAIPMFWGRKGFKPPDFKLERLRHANIKPDLSSYGGWAIVETTEQVVWPIIIFLIVSSYASIGLLSSVVIATGIFTTLYIGRRLELKGEKHYMKRGSATMSLTNFGRVFAGGVAGVFSMNILSGISFRVLEVSLFTRFYRHVGSGDTLEYLFAMEAFYGIVLASFYTVLLLLTIAFPAHTVLAVGLLLTIPASYFATRMR
jgi:MFS family permease